MRCDLSSPPHPADHWKRGRLTPADLETYETPAASQRAERRSRRGTLRRLGFVFGFPCHAYRRNSANGPIANSNVHCLPKTSTLKVPAPASGLPIISRRLHFGIPLVAKIPLNSGVQCCFTSAFTTWLRRLAAVSARSVSLRVRISSSPPRRKGRQVDAKPERRISSGIQVKRPAVPPSGCGVSPQAVLGASRSESEFYLNHKGELAANWAQRTTLLKAEYTIAQSISPQLSPATSPFAIPLRPLRLCGKLFHRCKVAVASRRSAHAWSTFRTWPALRSFKEQRPYCRFFHKPQVLKKGQ